ncbi:MAG TPA: hypothetical protein VN538_05040 [Clostridia bacterium]|nr:hypothetical protein [Clostridia bacterium]
MNVLGCAVAFGMGPTGKLSSIISESQDINWFLSGDQLELGIFTSPVNYLWTKDPDEISKYIIKNSITAAVCVLDMTMARILMNLKVRVIFVDSLPFMWTANDNLPTEVSVYCAQRSSKITNQDVLSGIRNLVWIDPIICKYEKKLNNQHFNAVVNFGGVSSPLGKNKDYLNCVLPAVMNALYIRFGSDMKMVITTSSNMVKDIEAILEFVPAYMRSSLSITTLDQSTFNGTVEDCDVLITSPGLTTILETSQMEIPTVLLPPQNLSQFYNSIFAESFLVYSKRINWDIDELAFEKVIKQSANGERSVVEYIYKNISLYWEKFGPYGLSSKIEDAITSSFVENTYAESRIASFRGTETVLSYIY